MEFEFKIDKSEVLRYLNTAEDFAEQSIHNLIDEAIVELKEIINFRYIYKKFPIEVRESGVDIKNTTLYLKGNSIVKHLKNSPEVFLMAATLGNQVDKRISYYEKTSITKSMILDACAATAIEEACDYLEEKIKKQVLAEGKKGITFRYSPGYGDLELEIQKEFLNVLNAPKKIGLTASKYNLLMPAKSVTAIIGVLEKNESQAIEEKNKGINDSFEEKNCKYCRLYKECELRKEGVYCGFRK